LLLTLELKGGRTTDLLPRAWHWMTSRRGTTFWKLRGEEFERGRERRWLGRDGAGAEAGSAVGRSKGDTDFIQLRFGGVRITITIRPGSQG
jgi:hypothetical protein